MHDPECLSTAMILFGMVLFMLAAGFAYLGYKVLASK